MRKLIFLSLLSIGMIGSSVAQMAIPGGIFADNPSRFNGRKVTIKNVQIDMNDMVGTNQSAVSVSPMNGPVNLSSVAPGPQGHNTIVRCNPPRGFEMVKVFFLEKPEFETCFFMAKPMYEQLKRETGGQTVDVHLTFRGDSRTGYNVTFYRIGK